MAQLGTAWVDVKGDFSKFNSQIDKALGPLQAKFGKLGKGATVGLAGVATAATGVGAALIGIGANFDDAYDKIRVGTGKTGKALEGLKGDFRDVVSSVPTDFGPAAQAVSELNQRLGLTGAPLQALSRRMLELSRITGTDLGTNIANITRVFGDWGIKTNDQASAMDKLFRASQRTGVPVDRLSEIVVKFGAPLRQLGFGFSEAAAMVGKFEKEGVNTELVMGSLRIALGKMSKESGAAAAAQKSLAGAQEAVHSASEGVANAQEGVRTALMGVQSAEKGLADAQRAGKEAQARLTGARSEARRELYDLKESLDDLRRGEAGSQLSLERAQTRLNEVMADSESTDLDVREALFAVTEAEDAASDATRNRRRAQKDNTKAQKKGVEGSEKVVAVQKEIAAANERAVEAQKAVTEAQRDVTKANHGVAEANRDAARAQEGAAEAAKELSDVLGKNLLRAGESSAKAFRRITTEIKNAGSASEANRKAIELFGARAGPDMAAAIREGRFEIDDLVKGIAHGRDTITGASADTKDFAEKWKEFRNKAIVGLEPQAVRAFDAISRGMDKIGPAFDSARRAVDGFNTSQNFFVATTRRVIPAVAQHFRAMGQTIRGVGRIVLAVLTLDFPRALSGVKDLVKGTLDGVVAQLKLSTAPLREAATKLGGAIKSGISAGIKGLVGIVRSIINKVIDAVNGIIEGVNYVADKDPTGIAPHINPIQHVGPKEKEKTPVTLKKRKPSSGPAGGDPAGRFSSRGGPIIGELHISTPSGENPDGVATGVLIGRTIEQRFGGDPRQEP